MAWLVAIAYSHGRRRPARLVLPDLQEDLDEGVLEHVVGQVVIADVAAKIAE